MGKKDFVFIEIIYMDGQRRQMSIGMRKLVFSFLACIATNSVGRFTLCLPVASADNLGKQFEPR